MEPFEILASPFEAYWAPVGESFPDLADAPAGNWTLIGKSGDKNYSEDGVSVQHNQEVELFTPLGATGPIKASRTTEGLLVTFTVWDIRTEVYRLALNQNTENTTAPAAGTAGTKDVDLYQGLTVSAVALLVRGVSPFDDTFKAQYQIPRAFQSGSPNPVYQKGEPAGLELEFTALLDLNASSDSEQFGKLVEQDAAAS